MIIDCISDLHGYFPKLEGGDVLIVAGDLTARHTQDEFYEFANWIRNQEYEDKIVIAGNHDTWFQEADSWYIKNWIDTGEFEFLHDDGTELENGLKIWGSPWSLWFHGINPNCKAFVDKEKKLEKKFQKIPTATDILITHSPPYGILDKTYEENHVGSESLRYHVINRIKPKIHVYGHIHECGGKVCDTTLTKFVNASYVNENYQPVNKPVRVII